MTKGTSDVAARLQPLHMADEPIAQAVVSSDQAERLRAVEAYIRANNALKSDALALISSLVAENEAQAKENHEVLADYRRHYKRADEAERLLAEAREALTWAMDEIDVLSNRAHGFAYPQGMQFSRRADQLSNYEKAIAARASIGGVNG